ncbi:hypothetical protein [uncultured Algoriphagus sp.]|uniref:hypothetical protein n=1 Tax=uncultured Algoriphagus sp. TaxID=417365 RepID=UPI0025850791|nr:hypothetical protein [uncultured Algoriphagus sp.]
MISKAINGESQVFDSLTESERDGIIPSRSYAIILTWLEARMEPILRSLTLRLQSWDQCISQKKRKWMYALLFLLIGLLIYLPSRMADSAGKAKISPAVFIAPLPQTDPLIAPDTLLIYLSPKPICYEE